MIAWRGGRRSAARTERAQTPLSRGGVISDLVIHDVKGMELDPVARNIDLVIAGHSHRPRIDHRGSVTYLNPGSAGPRRFSLPISVALIDVDATSLEPRLVTLDIYDQSPP
jgi:predicted phosphodiesterase